MGSVKGVGVDQDAEPLNEPVTVLITPGGIEIDADDWSHANNLIATGCTVKEGYPASPGDVPSNEVKASEQGSSTSTDRPAAPVTPAGVPGTAQSGGSSSAEKTAAQSSTQGGARG